MARAIVATVEYVLVAQLLITRKELVQIYRGWSRPDEGENRVVSIEEGRPKRSEPETSEG